MAQNVPQRKETPPGPSPNSPSLLFEYQCRSGKYIRLANRIESKLFCPNWNALLRGSCRYLTAVAESVCFRCPVRNSTAARVVAMSLYGPNRRYTMGAVRNAQLAPVIYPRWTLRFYVELPTTVRRYAAVPTRLFIIIIIIRAYSKEFFGVHNFKSSCMM